MTSDNEILANIILEYIPGADGPADSRSIADAILAAGFVRASGWEYSVSWLEGDERVFRPVEDAWRSGVEVQRINQGYPHPEENYVARRRGAGDWEKVESP